MIAVLKCKECGRHVGYLESDDFKDVDGEGVYSGIAEIQYPKGTLYVKCDQCMRPVAKTFINVKGKWKEI